MTNQIKIPIEMPLQLAGDDTQWITVSGRHIPLGAGEDKGEAIKRFFDKVKGANASPADDSRGKVSPNSLEEAKGAKNRGTNGDSPPSSASPSPTESKDRKDSPASTFDRKKWESLDVGARRDEWEKMSASQRDEQADAQHSVRARMDELLSKIPAAPNSGNLTRDVADHITQFKELIHPQAADKLHSVAKGFQNQLKEAGVKLDVQRKLMMAAIDTLGAQEIEGMGRQLGDHGVAHIKGDIDVAHQALEALPFQVSAKDQAAATIACIFHDAGYMAPPSTMFLDEGHPRWSEHHYTEHIKPLVQEALGNNLANEISHIIRTHDSTEMDWQSDPIASAVRLSDNLALFHAQKMPPIFRYVPGNVDVLKKLGAKEIDAKEAQKQLTANVNKSNLSKEMKERLKEGAKEVSAFTPKVTLGMLGGTLSDIKWNGKEKHVEAHVDENKQQTELNKLGDFGQSQFAKLAKTYGADPKQFRKDLNFEFKKPNGQTVLKVISHKGVGALSLDMPIELGGPGSGNFGHSGRPGERGGSSSEGGLEKVPAEPGKTPIPAGHVRLYHYMNNPPQPEGEHLEYDALVSHGAKILAKEGIDINKAKGHTYQEPDIVWASTEKPHSGKLFAEFSVPHDDPRFTLGGPKDDLGFKEHQLGRKLTDDERDAVLKEWEGRNPNVAFSDSIKPSEIVAVHEPWHHTYRYIMDSPKALQETIEGKNDFLLDKAEYGPAVAQVKAEHAQSLSPQEESSGVEIDEGNDEPTKSSDDVAEMSPKLASIAQKVYDDWDEENVDEYAGGGICHLIAEDIASELSSQGIEASTVSQSMGEQHVYVVAKLKDGIYSIDISPYTYESGGGYSWKKIQGVELTESDITINHIDSDPNTFNDYLDLSLGMVRVPIEAPLELRRSADHPDDHWITIHGRHLLVQEGETVDDAFKRMVKQPIPPHLKGLAIPPAWTKLEFNMNPKAEKLVQGRDEKGKKQAIFSAEHKMLAAEANFAKTSEIIRDMKKVMKQNDENGKKPEYKDMAAVIRLVQSTGIRVGSGADTKAEKEAYGASTLMGQHVMKTTNVIKVLQDKLKTLETQLAKDSKLNSKVAKKRAKATSKQMEATDEKLGEVQAEYKRDKDGIHLCFVGKKGVDLVLPVKDKAIKQEVLNRAKKAGPNGQLYDTVYNKLLAYTKTLGGGGFTPKEFRTAKATLMAKDLVSKMEPPKTEEEFEEKFKEVCYKCSRVLGNTPKICGDSYIDPIVFTNWRKVKW